MAVETKTRRFHFSLGNSSDGPVGFCAAVHATSKKEAVEKLRKALPDCQKVGPFSDVDGIEYIEIYFNELEVTEMDIDEVTRA